MGRTLAMLAKSNAAPSTVLAIRSQSGEVVSSTLKIVQAFRDYYKKLYSSQKRGKEAKMEDFLRGLDIPTISQEERDILDAPISIAELHQAVAGMATHKSPGPDGLPIETYKRYGEVLIPELLKVLGGRLRGANYLPQC